MSESSKYRLLAQRSGIAGIVILVSWCILIISYVALDYMPILWYLMRLAGFLLMVLPIPAIVIGLWSFRGLNRKDHSQEIGYAIFGILSGLLSILAAIYLIIYVAVHFDWQAADEW